MIAKRGVKINAVHFHSYPYTSDRAKEKVLDLARILSESCCGIRVHIVPFTRIQMEIHEKCPEEYTTLIMRRCMMRIAERIACKTESMALITGESIGQVASQTMEALNVTDSVVSMPVFRPLIGSDKEEIIEVARKIGTFETSSWPYEIAAPSLRPGIRQRIPKWKRLTWERAAWIWRPCWTKQWKIPRSFPSKAGGAPAAGMPLVAPVRLLYTWKAG